MVPNVSKCKTWTGTATRLDMFQKNKRWITAQMKCVYHCATKIGRCIVLPHCYPQVTNWNNCGNSTAVENESSWWRQQRQWMTETEVKQEWTDGNERDGGCAVSGQSLTKIWGVLLRDAYLLIHLGVLLCLLTALRSGLQGKFVILIVLMVALPVVAILIIPHENTGRADSQKLSLLDRTF